MFQRVADFDCVSTGLSKFEICANAPDLHETAKLRLKSVADRIDSTNHSLLDVRQEPAVNPKFEYLHFLSNAVANLQLLADMHSNTQWINDTSVVFEHLFALSDDAVAVHKFHESKLTHKCKKLNC